MKKYFIISLLCALTVFSAAAQSADSVTKMISTKKVTYGQAAYFSACALNLIDDDASENDALNMFKNAGVVPMNTNPKSYINLKQIAWICSSTWKIKGSFMYHIKPTARYAFIQMKADGVIEAASDPSRIPDGHEYLNIITRCLETYKIADKIRKVEAD